MHPFISVTVNVTWNKPVLLYRYVGFCSVDVPVPSPNSQNHVVICPDGEEISVNVVISPKHVESISKFAIGSQYTSTIIVVSSTHPLSSVTVRVTLYVPH